ncbi:MAG: TonB-dependent receptor [Bacteroidetes bacterium]|nr:TonB-dependent receptor [Bacteroidota bacterium]
MSIRFFVTTLPLLIITFSALGQQKTTSVISGQVVDHEENIPLAGVTVLLETITDSALVVAGTSNLDGYFAVKLDQAGEFRLRLSFVGFTPHEQLIAINGPYRSLGTIQLKPDLLQLGEIVVEELQERMFIRGDTTVFVADAYKVNPDATAEELVAKLPGVVVQDGQVEAQGEQVQRVTVDGREYFGQDPTAALRNLPADMIQNIEIFDRDSDQSQFTGFDDGNSERTINVVTRRGMTNGQFGQVYGGYGDDQRYIAGGNTNIFDNQRRISIIALSNNINQQNFAFQDLLGLMGSTGRGRGNSGAMIRRGTGRGGGGRRGGGFDPRNFIVGRQNGLNHTSSSGINYSDELGGKIRISASYFFNRVSNENHALLDRELFLSSNQSQFYNESTQSSNKNFNHRLNARIEYTINPANSLIIRPSLSFQNNTSSSFQSGINSLVTGRLLNTAENNHIADNGGFTSSTSILYRHRFGKPGRTISTDLRLGFDRRSGNTNQVSVTEFLQHQHRGIATASDSTYDQDIDNKTAGQSYSIRLAYTEPLGEFGQLQLTYNPTYTRNESDRSAYVLDLRSGLYTILDPTFSNLFDNDIVRQRSGFSVQRRIDNRYSIEIGAQFQHERLIGDQMYPVPFQLDRSFIRVLPQAEIELELGEALDLDIDYRTRTNTPSINQLQDVLDNSNPLFLSSGNPDLVPSFSHTIRIRGRRGDRRAGRMMFAFVSWTRETNSIGTSSFLASRDTLIAENILLPQGAQYSAPLNLKDPSTSIRSMIGIGTPVQLLRSNLNFRGGITYSKVPSLINNVDNLGTQFSLNGGLTLGSNISERLDFTLTYNFAYTAANNSYYSPLDEKFYRQDAGTRFVWLPYRGLIFEQSLTYNNYLGLDQEQYPTTFILNAGIGYKFLQANAAELKLVLGDILNQETGINRMITESYVEDSQTQVLGRYILLNLSYRFRNFGL